jgi:hypothetical protein
MKVAPWDFRTAFSPGMETPFKRALVSQIRARLPGGTVFRIETEETEPGFPDLLLCRGKEYHLIETKVSDARGVITFTKAQPAFYRRHKDLEISVFAWDVPRNRCVEITPEDLKGMDGLRWAIPEAV